MTTCGLILMSFLCFQGNSIYSDTAAANYGAARDSSIFERSMPLIPLGRLGESH